MSPWTDWKEVDSAMESLSKRIKQDVEQKLNVRFNLYKPLVYKTQWAEGDGKNYILKLYVGDNKIVSINAWDPEDASKNPMMRNVELLDLPGQNA